MIQRLSFRTERSVVKNPDAIKLDVHEILRFALDDKTLRLVIQTTVGRKNLDDIK